MAHFEKAKTHHAKIGAALKAGNAKLAMQHTGHMMLALRASGGASNGADEPEPSPPLTASPVAEMAPMSGIRGRLAAFARRT